ncbi:AAA family ATPase [Paenibacillus silvae]|uniref:AAA family ATPase n=1 Tax=Paenibacillus TaxID=44249 RepID=UPI001C11EC3A|nr:MULTISPECIES: AAA family ATPase [Paenibacillus]MBU5351124.1 ATP-binding protein [Paenibacillus barcinonensis]MDM5278250.1 AAA family ATPase [Paenibacillus silvae]
MNKTIYMISGPPGVGKSTTSQQLVQTLSKSAYISGDDISHIPVNGRGKPWLCKETYDLTWKNILSITRNLLEQDYDVVIDYVTFPSEVEWLVQQLSNLEYQVVYVVLLADQSTLLNRDQLRPADQQMGERSLVLLEKFKMCSELKERYKLYTQQYSRELLCEIVEDIQHNPRFIWKGERSK